MNITEDARYREAAEYDTTVKTAQKAAGLVTPADCLAYELKQYVAAYSQQVYSREYRDEKGPELLSEEHPDYPQRLADRKEEGERQLREIYALHGQELADEWAAARSDTLDERLLLACLLKESAHRLLDGYAHYLTQVGTGRISPAERTGVPIPFRISRSDIRPVETFASRLSQMQNRDKSGNIGYGLSYSSGKYAELDRALTAAGAGAAELAHFHELLAAFHEREPAASKQVRQPVNQRTKNEARLHHLSASEVRQLLTELGMGRLYNKPGEWAAAFRGLYIAGVLEGNAPEVTRWANEQGYTELDIKETIKKTWSGEWNEAGQFGNSEQSSVFSKTIDAANKLLILSKLSHSDE